MLRRGSIPLIEIAAACGFSSHAHLSRSFRKAVGVAPNQYRRVPDLFYVNMTLLGKQATATFATL